MIEKSQDSYRTVFAASPVGIGLSDERGHFVAVNAALCVLLGRSESELLGRSTSGFTHPDGLESHRNAGALLAAAPDGVLRIEKRYLRPDGQSRWAWLTITHTPGPAGQRWTLAHVQDVTERKAAEQTLRDSEADLTAVAAVVRRIQSGEDARATVVAATRELAGASHATLAEPDGNGALLVTAATDPALLNTKVSLSATSATVQVFKTGESMFVADPADHPLISPALLRLTGARSIFLVPIRSRDRTSGVLLVAWQHREAGISTRAARASSLLADEAGLALEHAKLLADLERRATCSIGYATWDTVETAHELMHRVDRALYAAKRIRTGPYP